MRLKSAALLAVGVLAVGVWPHGGARCQSSLGPPLSLAPPPWGTDQASPPAATSNPASPGVSSSRSTAKGLPPPSTGNVWPPAGSDDVPAPTAGARRSTPSSAAKDSPPAPPPKPAADYDGFSVGIDDGEVAGHPLPKSHGPAKQLKVRPKPGTAEGPSAMQPLGDQAEGEKLKPKLTICRGC